MKMRKRLIAISLVLGMTAGLAACGNKTNQNGEQNFFLKLSHYRAEGSVADVDINKFADEVNAADERVSLSIKALEERPANAEGENSTRTGKYRRCGNAVCDTWNKCG